MMRAALMAFALVMAVLAAASIMALWAVQPECVPVKASVKKWRV
jgi:hypothetical protein